MTTQTPVNTIQLDKMTKAQFDALTTKDQTHLYVITDESTDGLPEQTGHEGQYLKTDGTDASWSDIQASSIIDQHTTSEVKYWSGTLAEYNSGSITLTGYLAGNGNKIVIVPSGNPRKGMEVHVTNAKPTAEEFILEKGVITNVLKVGQTVLTIGISSDNENFTVVPSSQQASGIFTCGLSVLHPDWIFYITDVGKVKFGGVTISDRVLDTINDRIYPQKLASDPAIGKCLMVSGTNQLSWGDVTSTTITYWED